MDLPKYQTDTPLDPSFNKDIRDTHLVYDYKAKGSKGVPEKWRHEIWFYSENCVVYEIHSGPMAGRKTYLTATYQCIRPGELWQINWIEDTGTIVSLVLDLVGETMSAMIAFSKGHWENIQDSYGDKRNPADANRWKEFALVGTQTERLILTEQAHIVEHFKGKGSLEAIPADA
ncbi:uncharacterized protein FFFS_15841 [Fusarium fujikuroi]|nr:uncharacterized protein FFFS_15841 [Fusarium fujikuroi]